MRSLVIGAALMTLAFSSFASDESAALLKKLKDKYPNTTFSSIASTPVKGIYEITMGKSIAYSDAGGRYFIIGSMFDMQERVDLTAAKREAAKRIEWDQLPLAQSFKVVKGSGKRVFAMFSDPDCPFCRRIEQTLAEMDDYTMYVFPFPIASLHPKAAEKAISVWCATDKVAAWQSLMLKNQEPATANCTNPIEDNVRLAASLGISGTPTLIRPDGNMRPGALPREALEAWLSGK